MDHKNLEERLLVQVKKAAELIKNDIPALFYNRLCSTITMCQRYMEGADGLGWDDVYEEIYREEETEEECGIYIMSQFIDTPDEVTLLLALPVDILAYICWLGCKAQNDYLPGDLLSVIGERIPDYVDFLEENLKGKEDFEKAIDFANENLCY